jgi:hypothetical protein
VDRLSIRIVLNEPDGTWHAHVVDANLTPSLLVARRYVDLRRVSSALCRVTD